LATDEHAIVAATDAAGNITYANDRFCAISGYDRGELIGENHRILKSNQHPPEYFVDLWETIAGGRVWQGDICNRSKSGALYWVQTTIVPFLDSSGRPVQYIALRTEISRLKQVEIELSELTRGLEKRVDERTTELEKVNAALQAEMDSRRLAAGKVEQSESLYRLLFSSVTDYFYTVEIRDGRAANTVHTAGCAAVTGYAPGEFEADPLLWIKMVEPEERPAVEAQAESALRGEDPAPLEHRIVRKDGTTRWIRNTIVIRRDQGGAVAFYDGIISDITATRSAQEEIERLNRELEHRVLERTEQLKSANEQFRLLFEHAPVGISWVEWGNPDKYHLNERFCEIIGLKPEESEDFGNIMRATHPDDRVRQAAMMQEIWSGGRDLFSLEKRYLHRDGNTVWANLTVAVLRSEAGRITQQFALLEDVTERHSAEERLRRSEQRFRRYVENANEILYSVSEDGKFLYVSPNWTSKLGHPVSDVTGQAMETFIHPDDAPAFRTFVQQVLLRGRSTVSIEYRVRHRDGEFRWHASSGAAYLDDAGDKIYVGVARDISERIRSQEALRHALAQREEMESIINRSPSVVVLWRAAGTGIWRVEYVSENVSQFGYSVEDILAGGIRFLDMVHPDDRDRVAREVEAHAASGRHEYSQEYRIQAEGGNVHWIDDRTLVRVDPDGRVTHHEGILTDITERKAAEMREEEARERDLRMARDVQQHLLPDAFPELAEIEVQSLYTPSRHIGGDYYDFFEVAPRRWAFAVADVSGKGASAALVMAACRTALRIEAGRHGSPAVLLRAVNRFIRPDIAEGMFVSMIYGILDLDTRAFTFCRAGHESPVIVRARDGEEQIPTPAGMALGLDEGPLFDEEIEEETVVLTPGDLLILYTDGLTEILNGAGEEFGRDQLLAVVRGARTESAAAIVRHIDSASQSYAGNHAPGDDRTLVVIRAK